MMEGEFLLIELKFDTDGHRLEKKVLEILAKYGDKLAGYALQSFDPRTVRYLNRHDCSAGLLMMQRKGVSKFINTRFVARYAKAKFLSVSRDTVSEPSVQRFRSLKGPVLCWTIRNREQLRDAEDYADGFIAEGFLDEIGYANYITEI
jgi:glycerophosphoryl diester phosphodiesterase